MFFRAKPKNELNNALLDRATPAPQRNLADIFAELEASDRRMAERRGGNTDRRQGDDRRQTVERRSGEDRRSEEQASATEALPEVVPEIAPVVAVSSTGETAMAVAELEPKLEPEMPEVSADMRLVALAAEEIKRDHEQLEPIQAEQAPAEDIALPEFDDAQRRATAQRQAIEAMLEQARRIEHTIAAEAADALMAARQLSLNEKNEAAARAAEAEQQASARAIESAAESVRIAEEHDRAMTALGVACSEMADASGRVTEFETRLREALQALDEAKAKVREGEELAAGIAARAEKAKLEAQEAHRFASECREARETAEDGVREAEQLARELAPSSHASEALRALEVQTGGVGLSAQFN